MARKYRFKLYDPRGYLIYLECDFENPVKSGIPYKLQKHLLENLARNMIPASETVYRRWKEKLEDREPFRVGRYRILKIVRAHRPPKSSEVRKR